MTDAEIEGRLVEVPVQCVLGRWESIFGGEVPAIDGAYAKLVIRLNSIQEREFLQAMQRELLIKVFDEGTTLYVALSCSGEGMKPPNGLVEHRVAPRYWPGDRCGFMPIRLGPPSGASSHIDPAKGGLWMRHVGIDHCELISSCVQLLDRGDDPQQPFYATSLNHAFTRLSEDYERHRISHTGNVYERMFYAEANGVWYPLAGMRDGVRERAEQVILAEAWSRIESELGWCRLPPDKTRAPRGGRRGG